MKKSIILLAFMAIFSLAASAQAKQFNSSQLALRTGIQNFLKAEGFQPIIDDDGDIKFKRQGDSYYVIVSDVDNSPMYIRLAKFFSYGDHLNQTRLTLAATEINKYKMCKLNIGENSYTLAIEMYLTNYTAFTSIFYKVISIMDSAEQEISEL